MASSISNNSDADVLVLGAASFIGQELMRQLGRRAVGTVRTQFTAEYLSFDASTDDLAPLLRGRDFRHAVVLLGETKPDVCARDPWSSFRINVSAVTGIIHRLLERNIVPLFASTEVVFDGVSGQYRESHIPQPILLYGRQKLAIENVLAASGHPHVVMRIGRTYDSDPDGKTLLAEVLRQVRGGGSLKVAWDQFFSPIHVEDLCAQIVALIDGNHTGIFHLAGPQALSRLDVTEMVAALCRQAKESVDVTPVPVKFSSFPALEPRPLNVSMINEKAVATTGIVPRSMESVCRLMLGLPHG